VTADPLTSLIAEQIDGDLADCPYYTGTGSCGSGCVDEPECITCRPTGGWPSEHVVAAIKANPEVVLEALGLEEVPAELVEGRYLRKQESTHAPNIWLYGDRKGFEVRVFVMRKETSDGV
jgi:hypothetical protein